MNKKKSLQKISKIVSLAADLSELLNDVVNEYEPVLGSELADRMRNESTEISTCLYLLSECIEAENKNLKSIPIFENDAENVRKIN